MKLRNLSVLLFAAACGGGSDPNTPAGAGAATRHKVEALMRGTNQDVQLLNGKPSDLAYAKDFSGAPLVKNANYGHALAYQLPFRARFGLRLTF